MVVVVVWRALAERDPGLFVGNRRLPLPVLMMVSVMGIGVPVRYVEMGVRGLEAMVEDVRRTGGGGLDEREREGDAAQRPQLRQNGPKVPHVRALPRTPAAHKLVGPDPITGVPMSLNTPTLFPLAKVAERLSVSKKTVSRRVESGELRPQTGGPMAHLRLRACKGPDPAPPFTANVLLCP